MAPPAVTDSMPESSRQHLISVAAEMMYQRGYASVNVTEVVKTAGFRAQFDQLIDSKAVLGAEVEPRCQIQRMFSLLQREQLASHGQFGHCVGSSFARFAGEGASTAVARGGRGGLSSVA